MEGIITCDHLIEHNVYNMKREATFSILLRTKVFTNGTLFEYHLNLCCGITMFDRLELVQFYIKRP
jgi:hypothetical protein